MNTHSTSSHRLHEAVFLQHNIPVNSLHPAPNKLSGTHEQLSPPVPDKLSGRELRLYKPISSYQKYV